MIVKNIAVMHTVKEYNLLVNSNIFVNNCIIYCSHAGIYEYIKDVENYENVYLISELFSTDEILFLENTANEISNSVINNCDSKYSSYISSEFGIDNMQFFKSLYSYHFPMVIHGFLIIKEFLKKVSSSNIVIFDYIDPSYKFFSLKSFISNELPDKSFTWFSSYPDIPCHRSGFIQIFKRVFKKLYYMISDFYYELRSNKYIINGTVLYMDPLYQMSFIKKGLKYKIISFGLQQVNPKFIHNNVKIIKDDIILKIEPSHNSKDEYAFLTNKLLEHFIHNSKHYYIGIQVLKKIIKSYNIRVAVWGTPPDSGVKSLFYEYCMLRGIDVLGMQHGGSYVDQNMPKHLISDFMRCNYFISFGFSKSDLEENFKEKDLHNLTILPYGIVNTIQKEFLHHKNQQYIDVLFPVSNTLSLQFGSSNGRVKPDILHSDQINILNFLEALKLNTIIKPFPNTNINQTSVYYNLQKLKNCQIMWNSSLVEVMSCKSSKCIVLELLSTTLYEVLSHDIEIFLFIRETDNLTKKAQELLEKRVYICYSFKEFQVKFLKYFNGTLKSKRNNEFYDYYVSKENTKSKILQFIHSRFKSHPIKNSLND